ncbi:hypothetical protein UC35_14970 [Ramlibacter tataouinensis]|uniref:Uncharacterized protein n=2 Tax=Ramlibacter tataouinensis TaxID=94132 RepID=A0A127JV94_9BURK|nr:hypothetical protein UC35_14970 [Ramlibacter tataouinensis]
MMLTPQFHTLSSDDLLLRVLPYRLNALDIMVLVLNHAAAWGGERPMEVHVNGKLKFTGNTNFLINPVIEAGILHTRALLEFLGLRVTKRMRLAEVKKRRAADDAGIERLVVAGVRLKMVSVLKVLYEFPGSVTEDPAGVEDLLVGALVSANKGVAHLTDPYDPVHLVVIRQAALLTRQLVDEHVYRAAGLSPPVQIVREVA